MNGEISLKSYLGQGAKFEVRLHRVPISLEKEAFTGTPKAISAPEILSLQPFWLLMMWI